MNVRQVSWKTNFLKSILMSGNILARDAVGLLPNLLWSYNVAVSVWNGDDALSNHGQFSLRG